MTVIATAATATNTCVMSLSKSSTSTPIRAATCRTVSPLRRTSTLSGWLGLRTKTCEPARSREFALKPGKRDAFHATSSGGLAPSRAYRRRVPRNVTEEGGSGSRGPGGVG